ncbi:MAG: 3'-5' exonuclease [Steroidobacteraceae bacterium]
MLKRREQTCRCAARRCCSTLQPGDLLEDRAPAAQDPFVKYGGLRFLEAAHQGPAVDPSLGGQPAQRHRRLPRAAAAAGHGPGDGAQGAAVLRRARPFGGRAAGSCRRGVAGSIYPQARRPARRDRRTERAWSGRCASRAGGYRPHFERIFEQFRAPRRPRPARGTVRPVRLAQRFLSELTLDPPQATSDLAGQPLLDEDYLVLSTVHSAKGMEWQSVYVLNVVDGSFPSEFATRSRRSSRRSAGCCTLR